MGAVLAVITGVVALVGHLVNRFGPAHAPPRPAQIEAERARLEEKRAQLEQEQQKQRQAKEEQQRAQQELEQQQAVIKQQLAKLQSDQNEAEHQRAKERSEHSEQMEALKREQEALQERDRQMKQEADQLREQQKKLQQRMEDQQRQEEKAKQAEEELRNYPMAQYQIDNGFGTGTINIGVAGEVSVGKSSFINAIRDVRPGTPQAAKVGVNQTTTIPTHYALPGFPQLRMWDLPGYGTPDFEQRTKLRDMGIKYFDAIVLICDSPMKESLLEVKQELTEHKVPHFVARNKIDQAIDSNDDNFGTPEEQTLKEVANALVEQGIQTPYMISCRSPSKYDFQSLCMDLKEAVVTGRGGPE